MLEQLVEVAESSSFSGVVSIDDGTGGEPWTFARGLADRGHGIEVMPRTCFGIASGSKGFTALAVIGLVDDGVLSLDTTPVPCSATTCRWIDDAVTVGHLLAHRSGIGDYLDEDDAGRDHRPCDDRAGPPSRRHRGFLGAARRVPAGLAPDERFAYNNGGYVVLALLAERGRGEPFHDLVHRRVLEPAGMTGHGLPAQRRASR